MNIANMRVKDGEVLIKPNRKKQGIIEIIRDEWEWENAGEVVLVGKGVKGIEEGNEVIFTEYAGREIIINEEMYFVMSYESILAVVEMAS